MREVAASSQPKWRSGLQAELHFSAVPPSGLWLPCGSGLCAKQVMEETENETAGTQIGCLAPYGHTRGTPDAHEAYLCGNVPPVLTCFLGHGAPVALPVLLDALHKQVILLGVQGPFFTSLFSQHGARVIVSHCHCHRHCCCCCCCCCSCCCHYKQAGLSLERESIQCEQADTGWFALCRGRRIRRSVWLMAQLRKGASAISQCRDQLLDGGRPLRGKGRLRKLVGEWVSCWAADLSGGNADSSLLGRANVLGRLGGDRERGKGGGGRHEEGWGPIRKGKGREGAGGGRGGGGGVWG